MVWCSLHLVLLLLMQHGTLKPTPLDDLTINLHLNNAPNEGPILGSHAMESEEWKTFKTSSKDPSCNKISNQRQEQQTLEKRKRIVGGERYIPHLREDVPDYENWMASIKNGRGERCGGVLISPHHVLTALHCIFDKNIDKFDTFDKVKIYFDPENLLFGKSVEFKPAKYYFVKSSSSRPEYLVRKVLKDDIVVIKLEKSINDVDRTASLQPLRISTISGKIASKMCQYWIAGWGLYKLVPKTVPNFLQYTNKLPGMDCPKYDNIRQNTIMCFERTNTDATCGGDSGSPGVVFLNGNWNLQGIHEGGRRAPKFKTPDCGEPRSISVDVDVYQYREQIAEWMQQ